VCGKLWLSQPLAGGWSQAVGFVLVCLVGIWHEDVFTFNFICKQTVVNAVLQVRFAKIMLQLTLLLFNTKEFRSTAV
jgi:hypothetical protein